MQKEPRGVECERMRWGPKGGGEILHTEAPGLELHTHPRAPDHLCGRGSPVPTATPTLDKHIEVQMNEATCTEV